VNRRAFLSFIPAALIAPQPTVYRLQGYTAAGGWAVEITTSDDVARALAGHPVGAVETMVSIERQHDSDWIHLD